MSSSTNRSATASWAPGRCRICAASIPVSPGTPRLRNVSVASCCSGCASPRQPWEGIAPASVCRRCLRQQLSGTSGTEVDPLNTGFHATSDIVREAGRPTARRSGGRCRRTGGRRRCRIARGVAVTITDSCLLDRPGFCGGPPYCPCRRARVDSRSPAGGLLTASQTSAPLWAHGVSGSWGWGGVGLSAVGLGSSWVLRVAEFGYGCASAGTTTLRNSRLVSALPSAQPPRTRSSSSVCSRTARPGCRVLGVRRTPTTCLPEGTLARTAATAGQGRR